MRSTTNEIDGAPRTLRVDEAAAIYELLVEFAGAPSHADERSSFIRYATADRSSGASRAFSASAGSSISTGGISRVSDAIGKTKRLPDAPWSTI